MGGEGLRGRILRVLVEIRRAQVRIRSAKAKLQSLNDVESAARLEALDELLERIALRLETLLVLGFASGELVRAAAVASRAIEPLKHHAPPDVAYILSDTQSVIEKLYNTWSSSSIEPIQPITRSEVEEVLREAIEKAKAKVGGSSNKSS